MKSEILVGFMILVPLFLVGCTGTTGNVINMANVVEKGDKVSVEYKGTYDNGEVFDQSSGKPLEFIAGAGQMIKGFDDAVTGMKLDEVKNIRLTPDMAYGERDENKKTALPREQFPLDFEIKKGAMVPLGTNTGEMLISTIVDFNDTAVILDLNHPMAGKTLNFEIKVVSIAKQ